MRMVLYSFVLATLVLLPLPSLAARESFTVPISTARSQIVLTVDEDSEVRTVHYGAVVGNPDQFLGMEKMAKSSYGNRRLSYPASGGKFIGQPALHVRYANGYHNTELFYSSHKVFSRNGFTTTEVLLEDPVTALRVKLVYDAYEAEDVIVIHSEIINAGQRPVELFDYASASLTLEADKYLLTHFSGGWAEEMQISSSILTREVKVLESRRGTQATQCANPSFMVSLGTGTFSETSGEVIAGALAWSGNFRISFDVDECDHLNIVSGVNPFASVWTLGAGETFVTPEMIYTWSGNGAGQASRNLHRWARKWWIYGCETENPTLLNSWEGAYFDFDTPKLIQMIEDTAAMGLEMFVLDDGWFGNEFPRNNAKAGLGDWNVNAEKLPEGIDSLARHAHSMGIKFGIWIEPEMVNPLSVLAKAHPDWIVKSEGRGIPQQRNQWVLDLTNPAVQDFVFGVFDRTMSLSDYIDYVKWDCNRPVFSFGSPYLGEEQDRFYVEYIQGFYRIMSRIREKYPEVIIQCCSSGGGRVDYGSLRHFNEVWTSDNTDALSRVRIQYGTSLIYPAAVMGSHVSAVPNHQTGSVTPLKFRFDIASSGRLGMELQPKTLSAEDYALAKKCIDSYGEFRDLVFSGDLYRLSSPYDSDYYALMYVSPDKQRAVAFVSCLKYQNRAKMTHTIRLEGLDPQAEYRVVEQNVQKSCFRGNGKSFTGAFLESGGFELSLLKPSTSAVFLLEAL